jgi:hypothetical protein
MRLSHGHGLIVRPGSSFTFVPQASSNCACVIFLAPRRWASSRRAPFRLAPSKLTPFRLAMLSQALLRLAPLRLASLRLALIRRRSG